MKNNMKTFTVNFKKWTIEYSVTELEPKNK